MFVTPAEIQAIIDQAFAAVEAAESTHPWAVYALKFANQLVDNSGIPAAVAAAINSLLSKKGVTPP